MSKKKPLLGGDRDELLDYIWSLAKAMGLHDWRIKLADAPPPAPPSGETPGAFCQVIDGRKYAVLHVAEDWMHWPGWELREVVCHELVHCHAAGIEAAFNGITHAVSQQAYDILHGAFRDALEHSIDGISVAWARTLPLPETAKE